ncbi:MAG TPA: sigma-70 family RNA polymerase sigma factor [Mycobacteriales bacterium]
MPVITPGFESVWPDVERRLRALLYRRGLDQPSADDVVQEVALRVLAHGVTFESAGDLLRWAAPVACRLHVDLLRHRARLTDPEEATDRPSRDDVAGEVADRLELQRALRAIARLRPADRDAIIDAVASEPAVPRDRQEAVRLAVRRHRARTRLAVVLEQLAGWVAATLAGWRALLRDRRGHVLAALVPAAAVLPLILSPHTTPPPDSVAAPPPVAAAPAAPVVRAIATTRAVTATAVRAPVRPAATTVSRTRRAAPAPSARREDVKVRAPGIGIVAGRDARQSDDKFLCVTNVPVVDRVCTL